MTRDRSSQPTRPATIKDVARAAGVSFSTVSRVVNNSKRVDEPTRQRVLRAITDLRYVPNAMARGLQTRRSRSLAVLLPEIGSSGAAQFLQGAEEEARHVGFAVILMTTGADSTREVDCFSLMRQRQVDGVLWAAATFAEAHKEWLEQYELPVVAVAQDFSAHGLPSVLVDNRQAAYDATTHLLDEGHRRVAMITGDLQDDAVGRGRLRGFEEALLDHGLMADDRLVVPGMLASQRSGYEAMGRLLEHSPTAVLAASDVLAMGAMQLILERGLSIPGDVSIMGFDDLEVAAHPALSLSTVAFDFKELGAVAARTLLDGLSVAEWEPRAVVLPHRLIIRSSVCSR